MGNIWRNPTFLNFVEIRHLEKRFSRFYAYSNDSIQSQQPDYYLKNKIYDEPDLEYDLDEYIQLDDMREVIVELLPNVKIFRLNDKTRIRVYHSGNTDILPDPLFLVNGRIVKDNDFILEMDIANIKNIDVIVEPEKLSYFGPVANGGVVAIYTKKPINVPFGTKINMLGYHLPDEIIRHGISKNQIDGSMPNFSPVIYWNPGLDYLVDEKTSLEFYLNDLTSEFEISVQGITKSGEVFFDKKEISVIKPVIN